MLHNLSLQYSGQVAVVSIYSTGGNPPFYNAVAHQKMYNYPPPYFYNNTWYYATPWLYVDGDRTAAYLTSTWSSQIAQHLQVPTDLQIDIFGDYNPTANQVNLQFQIINSGAVMAAGLFHAVLTEDNLQWSAPNGQQVHNHVPRIWWPHANGQDLTILPGDTSVVYADWNLDPAWVPAQLRVLAFLQDATMQPDSTYQIFQGAAEELLQLPTGIGEPNPLAIKTTELFPNYPNPFNPATTIRFQVAKTGWVNLDIYDPLGQKIRRLVSENKQPGSYSSVWDSRDNAGREVASGVYIYRLSIIPSSKGSRGDVQTRKMLLVR